MANHPVLVRKISHLTDARYFAAMGVDWMSMVLSVDPKSFMLWHTIREWVEGVKLAVEWDVTNEELTARVLIDAQPDGIIVNAAPSFQWQDTVFTLVDTPKGFIDSGHGNFILPSEYTSDVVDNRSQIDSSRIFLEDDWTEDKIRALLANGYTGGFCFAGEPEEEKGMRDYSKMDLLLEAIS